MEIPLGLPEPFVYERVFEPGEDVFSLNRCLGWNVKGEAPNKKFRTDEEVLGDLRKIIEGKNWFTKKYWREHGMPFEQFKIQVGDKAIGVYNWNQGAPLDDNRLGTIENIFRLFTSKFPQFTDKLDWLLIDNVQRSSNFSDPTNYPQSAGYNCNWKMISILPRGMENFPHRIARPQILKEH